jgi:putative Holliday junction resolvase
MAREDKGVSLRSIARRFRELLAAARRADYDPWMRIVGLDYGLTRIGVAICDGTATLARPLTTIRAGEADAVARVASLIDEVARDEAPPAAIVIGLPLRLDGTPHEMTGRVRAFGDALSVRTGLPVEYQDERLSSLEAEARLAAKYRSWQRRKALVDAAAAAVILQDYLDRTAGSRPDAGTPDQETDGQ